MARNLADMLGDQDLMAMTLLGKTKPDANAIAAAYGINLPLDKHVDPEELRDLLRAAFGRQGRDGIDQLVREHGLLPEVARIARVYGIDPVDLRAIAVWRDSGFRVAIADDVELTLFARRDEGRIETRIDLGRNQDVVWFTDERDAWHGMEINGAVPPETAAIALIGKGIEAAFRHRATDGVGLVIADVTVSPQRRSMKLHLRRDGTEQAGEGEDA